MGSRGVAPTPLDRGKKEPRISPKTDLAPPSLPDGILPWAEVLPAKELAPEEPDLRKGEAGFRGLLKKGLLS